MAGCGDVEIERAVNKFELFQPAIQKLLHFGEEFVQRDLPHGNVERREAKFAGERAAARRLDVNDAVREVVVGVKVVGQGDLRKVRQLGGDDFGQIRTRSPRPSERSPSPIRAGESGLFGVAFLHPWGRRGEGRVFSNARHTSANFKSASPVMTWSASWTICCSSVS